jgi:peptidoglycan/LPS O-acetylase OafA/YrhL
MLERVAMEAERFRARIEPDAPRHNARLSAALDHVRWISAFAVLFGHIRAELFAPYSALSDPGPVLAAFYAATTLPAEAVVCFFVISGTLVGGRCLVHLCDDPRQYRRYAVDRLTRLYVVLVPAVALTLVWDAVRASMTGGPSIIAPVSTIVGNLLFVQGVVVPWLPGNTPLWSLANELWYYLLFPLVLVAIRGRRAGTKLVAASACLALVGLLLAFDHFDRMHVVAYFAIWACGILALVPAGRPQARWPAAFLLVGALALSSTHMLDHWFLLRDAGIALALVTLLRAEASRSRDPFSRLGIAFNRLGRGLAGFSFSLYVVHWPLIKTLQFGCNTNEPGLLPLDPRDPTGLAVLVATALGCIGFAWVFHLAFERRTTSVRRWLYRRFRASDL